MSHSPECVTQCSLLPLHPASDATRQRKGSLLQCLVFSFSYPWVLCWLPMFMGICWCVTKGGMMKKTLIKPQMAQQKWMIERGNKDHQSWQWVSVLAITTGATCLLGMWQLRCIGGWIMITWHESFSAEANTLYQLLYRVLVSSPHPLLSSSICTIHILIR